MLGNVCIHSLCTVERLIFQCSRFFFCNRKIASALVGLWDTSCFSVVFSAKEVVNNLGHMTRPLRQGIIEFCIYRESLRNYVSVHVGNQGVFVLRSCPVVFGVWLTVILQL